MFVISVELNDERLSVCERHNCVYVEIAALNGRTCCQAFAQRIDFHLL